MKKRIALLRNVLTTFLLLSCFISFSQTGFTVTGKVTDETNKPLEGVTVQVKGTTTVTLTKTDGSFSIIAPSGNSVLVISSVGFREQEVPVNGRSQLNFTMSTAATTMADVVVVGYGTQRRSDVTGAVTSLSSKTIQERPVTNVVQALQGKAAGMNVASNIKPGEVPAVRIRGVRSNGPQDPLYVVDGIPIVSALGVTSFSIGDLNPNDIASIEVLKDASATAIYGSRGANGVILITTRKGAKGRVSVNFNSNVSLDKYKSLTDWINGGEYIDRLRQGLINGRRYQTLTVAESDLNVPVKQWYPSWDLDSLKFGGASITNSNNDLLAAVRKAYEWNTDGSVKMRATTAAEQAMGWPAMVPVYNSANIPSFDWMDAVTRQGLTQNHQVSVSSGTEASRLYLSLGYNGQKGVQRDQDYKRYNVNLNGDVAPLKWFGMGISVIASLAEQDFGISANSSNTGAKDLYGRAIDQFPWALPTDANGLYVRNPGGNLNTWNPLIDITQSINNRRTSSALSNVYTELKFTPWLKYRVNFGAQLRSFRNGTWTGPDVTGHLTQTANTGGYSKDENFSWVVENLLYFDKTFASKHSLGVTLLQSAQKSRRENSSISVGSLVNPISLWYDLGSNASVSAPGIGTGFTENKLSSFMGRVNYAFMNKYLLTASGRFDGSSVLAPGNKWDFFPSFALAWKMQEEKFLENVSWINEIKPRIGYGVTGNSNVAPYTTSGPLSRNNYVFGSTPAISFLPQLAQNPNLRWERTAQMNAGVDFSILRGRIGGSIEYYDQKTSNLIFPRGLPAVSGYVSKFMNVGNSRNRGAEVSLSTTNIQNKNFTWSTELNWSTNKEEITELVNGKQDMVSDALFIGQPWQVFYQWDYDGIWGSTDKDIAEMAKFNANGTKFRPGTVKVVDQNNDYKIDASDWVIRGTPRPKWYGGITNTFRYKDFSLSSFAYARIGQTYFGGYAGVFGRDERDVWSWNNQNGKWPMWILGNTDLTNYSSAMQYWNGSFVVIRHITITYDVPSKLIKRASMKNLQLSVQVLNPFIFGGDVVKMGINPDDETNWASQSQPGTANASPLGGTNNNTILPQSLVFGLRVGF